MSWKQWATVIAVIVLGILWQIPGHQDAETDSREHAHTPSADSAAEPAQSAPAASEPERAGPYRTIALEVAGMT